MGKRILVVGSGAREHALALAAARSPGVERVFIAPGNIGTEEIAENIPTSPTDVERLARFACDKRISFTIVGPEEPLGLGIVDRFRAFHLRIFGPTRDAARIETSKVFAKRLMEAHGIPTASYLVCENVAEIRSAAEHFGFPCVVKADGLAAGKGVFVCHDKRDLDEAVRKLLAKQRFVSPSKSVIVEKYLPGDEVSVHVITDGSRAILLPAAQDHKSLLDGDKGQNTGGMGAIAPVPWLTAADLNVIVGKVIRPALDGLREMGCPFTGCLFAGIKMTPDGPMCLEFNARFGDPEACVILPLLGCDLLELLERAVDGTLDGFHGEIIRPNASAAAIVLAAPGYPDKPVKGIPITGIGDAASHGAVVFHASTARTKAGLVVTAGGRVLDVAVCDDAPLDETIAHAYDAVSRISFYGMQFRRDIGEKSLQRAIAT